MTQRPLKFRVWDNGAGAYVTHPFHGPMPMFMLNLRFELGWIDDSFDGQRHPGYVIEQWTGLADRDRREVYEGDIVQERWSAPCGKMESTYVIRFGNYEDGEGFSSVGFYADYMLRPKPLAGQSGGNLRPKNTRWAVIGNVHETPHLLAPPTEPPSTPQ